MEYLNTSIIDGRRITQYVDKSETVQSLIVKGAVVSLMTVDGEPLFLDFKKMMFQPITLIPDVDTTTLDVLVENLTVFQQDALSAERPIPLKEVVTHNFTDRLKQSDAYGAAEVSYTSFIRPDRRNDPYLKVGMQDLVLTGLDPLRVNNCLVSVNGYYHRSLVFDDELYVAGGYQNMKSVHGQEVALVDTTNVGGHTTIMLTKAMIKPYPDTDLRDGFMLDLSRYPSLEGKLVVFCIHGKLYFTWNPGIKRTQPLAFKILPSHLNLIDLLIRHPMSTFTRSYRHPMSVVQDVTVDPTVDALSPLYDVESPIYKTPLDSKGIGSLDTLTSDPMIEELFDNGQSFLIAFNDPDIFIREFILQRGDKETEALYTFDGDETPRGLLIYDGGLTYPYMVTDIGDFKRFGVSFSPIRRTYYGDFKTAINGHVLMPWFDKVSKLSTPSKVKLIEFYK